MPDDLPALSLKQRQVLDLVVARKSSKEIARILGISKHTVDQRIVAARQKYGADNRNELVLRYLKGSPICDPVAYDTAQVPPDGSSSHSDERDKPVGPIFQVADLQGFVAHQAPFEFVSPARPLAMLDKRFGVWGRLAVIGGLATLMAISLLSVIAIAQTLSGLL